MASEQDITALVEKMTEERDKLLAQMGALSETEAMSAPSDAEGEAQWSPKQQACHLAEMETAYRAWVAKALVAEKFRSSRRTSTPSATSSTSSAHSARRPSR